MNLGPVLKVKTLKLKMVDNSVLFAKLLALVASLMECIEINFAILTTTISHFIQIVEYFSSGRRGAKYLGFEPRQRWFWVRPSQTSACSYDAAAEPDLQIGGSGLKKIFFRPFEPPFGLKIKGPLPWIRQWMGCFLLLAAYFSFHLSKYSPPWQVPCSSITWE